MELYIELGVPVVHTLDKYNRLHRTNLYVCQVRGTRYNVPGTKYLYSVA